MGDSLFSCTSRLKEILPIDPIGSRHLSMGFVEERQKHKERKTRYRRKYIWKILTVRQKKAAKYTFVKLKLADVSDLLFQTGWQMPKLAKHAESTRSVFFSAAEGSSRPGTHLARQDTTDISTISPEPARCSEHVTQRLWQQRRSSKTLVRCLLGRRQDKQRFDQAQLPHTRF